MKLKIMTFDAINYVKKNAAACISHYQNRDNPEEWIKDAIGVQAFVDVPELEFDDFELLINDDAPSSTEILNIKLLYKNLASLNESFASDERLWAGLAHTVFYDYMLRRWPNNITEKDIINHYFFSTGRPRCYMVNTLARLWWFGRKTMFLDEENPTAILDYIAHDINGYGFTLFGSNWSNSDRSLKLFFQAVFEYTNESGNKVGRALFNDAIQYANCLCGTYILDACSDSFVVNNVKTYLFTRSLEMKAEAEYNKLNNVKTTGVDKLDNVIKALNAIGGHGTSKQIMSAYEDITEKKNSDATKKYIKTSLYINCPDSGSFEPTGKPIFFKIVIGDDHYWKISNEYLIRANMAKRKELMESQIDSLSDMDCIVFNTINTIPNQRFTVADILQYKSAIASVYSDIEDIDAFIMNGLKTLRSKGLLELVDSEKQVLKKSYNIKLN